MGRVKDLFVAEFERRADEYALVHPSADPEDIERMVLVSMGVNPDA